MIYKNYIFDFGKVIVDFEPEYMTKQYIKDEADIKIAEEVIFDRLYWDKLDMGTITDEEVLAGVRSRLPERLHKAAADVYNNWYYHLPFIDGMRELTEEIKRGGGKLFLLSNISITFAENWNKVGELSELFSLFDGLIFSGSLGIVKPSAEIFRHLLTTYELRAEDCIFIDDNKNNTDGAERVGIKAYLFDGNSNALREKLM